MDIPISELNFIKLHDIQLCEVGFINRWVARVARHQGRIERYDVIAFDGTGVSYRAERVRPKIYHKANDDFDIIELASFSLSNRYVFNLDTAQAQRALSLIAWLPPSPRFLLAAN